MSLESPATIYRIPTPASDEDITKYSQIRLSALRKNPEAFSSTFADASLFSQEKWRSMVNTVGRTTLLALGATTSAGSAPTDGECLGTLSVLHPEMLRSIPDAFPRVVRVEEAVMRGLIIDRYLLVGMWVHPDARKKGIGRALIEDAIQVIKQDPVIRLDFDRVTDTNKKMVFLEVHTVNSAAKGLYTAMGFVEETECEGGEEGHTCMTYTL